MPVSCTMSLTSSSRSSAAARAVSTCRSERGATSERSIDASASAMFCTGVRSSWEAIETNSSHEASIAFSSSLIERSAVRSNR